MVLTEHEKGELIRQARAAVRDFLEQGILEDLPDPGLSPALREEKGVFVTISCGQDRTWCVGTTLALLPLWEACRVFARNAVYKDPRSAPMEVRDLPRARFSICIVGECRPLRDISQLTGRCRGIALRKGLRREVFLPDLIPDKPCDLDGLLRTLRLRASIDADGSEAPEEWEVFDAETVAE
ncbi:MAG TPA: AMMECR1 domain-containing protein [Deltaproteobacteria bacterium]|nr:AMMECR1 domain-containing protein [Deltaproteobacteria bacterium]